MPEGTNFSALLDQAEFELILAGDDLDEIRELIDRLSDQIGTAKARLWELEAAAGNPELREQRRDYYASR